MEEMENNPAKGYVNIPFKDFTIRLNYNFLDTDIDVSTVTQIDYSNLYGELITVSTLLNNIGLIRAEAESHMDKAKLHRDIQYATLDEEYRKSLRKITTDSKGNDKIKEATNDMVDAAIKRDENYISLCRSYINKKRHYNSIDALFWGVKSKEAKLNKIGESMKLTPEEFAENIIEGAINGVMIKAHKNLIS